MKHHSLAVDFSGLDFEKIDTKILEDEAKEQEEAEPGAMEKDKVAKKEIDESAVPTSWFHPPFFFLRTMGSPLYFWGFLTNNGCLLVLRLLFWQTMVASLFLGYYLEQFLALFMVELGYFML